MGAGGLFMLGFLVPSGRTQFCRAPRCIAAVMICNSGEKTLVWSFFRDMIGVDFQMREFVVDGLC